MLSNQLIMYIEHIARSTYCVCVCEGENIGLINTDATI